MATTNIGNLHILLQMNDRQFQAASKRVQTTNNQTSSSMNRLAGGGMKNLNRGFLELSRGVEDFAVVFGTSGFAGGLRAAGNNVSQFFAMMNPLAGALAGLGIAGLSAWTGFNKGADQASDKSSEIAQRIKDNLAKLNVPLGNLKDKFDDLLSGLGKEAALGPRLDQITETRKLLTALSQRDASRLQQLQKEVADARADLAGKRAIEARTGGRGAASPGFTGVFDFIATDVIEAEKKLADAERRLKDLHTIVRSTIQQRRDVAKDVIEAEKQLQRDAGPLRQGFLESLDRSLAFDPDAPSVSRFENSFNDLTSKARSLFSGPDLANAFRKIQNVSFRDINHEIQRLQEQVDRRRNRRLTELPGGTDIFTAEAQDRLARIATGRHRAEPETAQKQIAKLEEQIRLLRQLRDKITQTQPINLP